MLPLAGVTDLSGGADGVVCGLVTSPDPSTGKPAPCDVELLSARSLDGITVDARVRHVSDGEWKILGAKPCPLQADTPAKLSFEAWTPDKPGTWVLQSRISRGGKKLFGAEKTIVIGEATPMYRR